MTDMNENNPPSSVSRKNRSKALWRPLAAASLFAFSAVFTAALLALDFSPRLSGDEFVVGDPAPRSIYSAYEITYPDQKATQDLEERTARSVASVYRIRPSAEPEALRLYEETFQAAEAYWTQKKANSAAAPPLILPDVLTSQAKGAVKFLAEEEGWKAIQPPLKNLLESSFALGLFDKSEKQKLLDAGVREVTVLRSGKSERIVKTKDLVTPEDVRVLIEKSLPPELLKNKPAKNAAIELGTVFLKVNADRDESETGIRQKQAVDLLKPVLQTLKKSELVVQRGILITPKVKEKLDQIEKIMARREVMGRLIGLFLLSGLVWFLAALTFWIFLRRSWLSFSAQLLFHGCVLTTLVLSKGVMALQGASPYFMPTALASLLLILLAGGREAVLAGFILTAFSAALSNNSPEVILGTLLTSLTAIQAGTRIRKRSQFLKIGAGVGAVYFLVIFVFRFSAEIPLDAALKFSGLGLFNGLLITVSLAFILVPLLEWIFNLTTDISLLEMSDLNHPLLKKMIVEAPGTYHHSLVVSTLAESACEVIGANALLARVGCYFHDIGKIARAEYFTENQPSPGATKHGDLAPRVSSGIIMNHVRDGIELGKKYKLKPKVLDFIPEHQGTAVVYYFYRKAMEEAQPGEAVDMNRFRYPGPKPQSRETAVALLADSVEAASRTLKDMSPDGIQRLVRKIINDKFIDGQLDQCPLTLRDLQKIQESFVTNLLAIFHARVPYPEKLSHPDQPNLFQNQNQHARHSDEDPC